MATAKINQSPKRPADERQRQLLKAATRLFSKKGYRATTTEEIARAAGLTKGALYHHFKSKEEVLYSLVEAHMEHYHALIKERLGDDPTVEDFVDVHLDLTCGGDAGDYQVMVDIWVQAWKVPRMKRMMSNRIRQYVETMLELVKRPDGLSAHEFRNLIIAVLSARDGMSVLTILSPSLLDINAQRKILINMFKQSVS